MKTPAPHRCGVLIVEGDDDLRELLRVSLTAEGYGVAAVGDGRSALTYPRSHADTCTVLLDLLLPNVDGADSAPRSSAIVRSRGFPSC